DRHHRLLDPNRGEIARMLLGPVRYSKAGLAEQIGVRAPELADAERVSKTHGDAFGAAAQAVERARVGEVRQREAAVVIGHARIEDARDDEAREPRRRHAALVESRHEHAERVAAADAEARGERPPEHEAVPAG